MMLIAKFEGYESSYNLESDAKFALSLSADDSIVGARTYCDYKFIVNAIVPFFRSRGRSGSYCFDDDFKITYLNQLVSNF